MIAQPRAFPVLIQPAAPGPERTLLAAVVRFALHDALHGPPPQAADALVYLNGHNFESDCDWLDIDPGYVRKLLKERLSTMPKRRFTDDEVQRLHARYIDETVSLDELGRQNGTTGATLSRLFAAADLPARPPGGSAGHKTYDSLAALRELNRLLDALHGRPGTITITIHLEPQ